MGGLSPGFHRCLAIPLVLANQVTYYFDFMFFYLGLLAICTPCRKRHNELVNKEARWIKPLPIADEASHERGRGSRDYREFRFLNNF